MLRDEPSVVIRKESVVISSVVLYEDCAVIYGGEILNFYVCSPKYYYSDPEFFQHIIDYIGGLCNVAGSLFDS